MKFRALVLEIERLQFFSLTEKVTERATDNRHFPNCVLKTVKPYSVYIYIYKSLNRKSKIFVNAIFPTCKNKRK